MNTFTQSNLKKGKIRLGIPSKGRMYDQALEFFDQCGLSVIRNRRDYLAKISILPDIQVVFQRQEDIVRGVANGMLDFGIAGFDLVNEVPDSLDNIVIVHDKLGFGKCTLEIAIPEYWEVNDINDLDKSKLYRVASKFPKLTSSFLDQNNIKYQFVDGAGTLEVSPALGNSDFIVDLVSSGRTLEDNRLKRINKGCILESEAAFIGNLPSLLHDKRILNIAKTILEYFEATLRARRYVSVFANFRGTPDLVVSKLFENRGLSGLQGPTVSDVVNRTGEAWFAIHIIVEKSRLTEAISSIRRLGGSGVVVTPTLYIFEEKSQRSLELERIISVRRENND